MKYRPPRTVFHLPSAQCAHSARRVPRPTSSMRAALPPEVIVVSRRLLSSLLGRGRTATRAGAPPSFLAPRLCTSILFLLRGPATACIDGLAGAVVTSRLRHVLLRPCLAQPWRHG